MAQNSGSARFRPECAEPMGVAIDLILALYDEAPVEQALELLNSADPAHVTGHLAGLINAIGKLAYADGSQPQVPFRSPAPAMIHAIRVATRFLVDPKSIVSASFEDVRDGAGILVYTAAVLLQQWTGRRRPEQLLRSLRACCHDPDAMDRIIQQSGRCN